MWVDAKLVRAFNHADPEQGLRNALHLASRLLTWLTSWRSGRLQGCDLR